VRRDLADVRVAGRIFAPHYAKAEPLSALAPAPIQATRDATQPPISEILPGERFEMLELAGDLAWGICAADGSVGYVAAAALGDAFDVGHVVAKPVAPVHAEPDAESPKLWTLPMGARIAGAGEGAWSQVPGGYVAADMLRPIGKPFEDFVAVAESLIGVPATPGGRSGAGVNCTGLIFLALSMAGFLAPRFCDLQAEQLGRSLGDSDTARRGDLIYFDDHAAILTDAETVVHVGAEAVELASLDSVIVGGGYGEVLARKRIG